MAVVVREGIKNQTKNHDAHHPYCCLIHHYSPTDAVIILDKKIDMITMLKMMPIPLSSSSVAKFMLHLLQALQLQI